MSHIPLHRLDIPALTDEPGDNPSTAVQYSVVVDGKREMDSDQRWMADGRALWVYEGGRIECRDITISYGEWRPA